MLFTCSGRKTKLYKEYAEMNKGNVKNADYKELFLQYKN